MSQTLPQIIPEISSTFIEAFHFAVYGVLGSLALVVCAGLLQNVRDFFCYLKKHWGAIGFALGSGALNVRYRKFGLVGRLSEKCVLWEGNQASGKIAVIIPGTWSHSNYKWQRWEEYKNHLVQCGYRVYKFQWNAPNNEEQRCHAAKWLKNWLSTNFTESDHCVLIGHSYGGQVAAICADAPPVKDVVCIATPLVHTEKLQVPEIARNALALFTRAIWLSTLAFGMAVLFPTSMTWAYYLSDADPQKSVPVIVFTGYALYMIGRLAYHVMRPRSVGGIPTLPPHVRMICVHAAGDPIVEQFTAAAQSESVQPEAAIAFAEQKSLTPQGFKKWFTPFFVYCLVVVSLARANWSYISSLPYYQQVAEVFIVHVAFGVLAFFSFVALAWLLSTLHRGSALLHELLLDVLALVNWRALASDNRRFVVSHLAGLQGYERWVYAIHITDRVSNAIVVTATLPGTPFYEKHSNVISDADSVAKVAAFLCKHAGSPCSGARSRDIAQT